MTQELHVVVLGKGPPLVLLHGWGWHSGIWQPLIPQLIDSYQLFLVDLPGFGKSHLLTESYQFADLAKRIFQQVPLTATWLGWSLGGMLAWWIAIHYPEKVTRLITVASSPKFVSDDSWPGIPLATLQRFSQAILANYEKTLEDFLELQLRGSKNAALLLTELKSQISFCHTDALIGGLKLLRETDLRQDLKKIKCPSLHIFGANDTLVPIAVIPYLQKYLSAHSRCEIIKRAGHIPFLSQPDEFLKLLL